MDGRYFSDTVKFEVIKQNLEDNGGGICCAICHKKLLSISECHFDHITPYAKGGKSIFANCQILCSDCNLKKNDKLLQEFVLEEKARRFLTGESLVIEKECQETEAQPATAVCMTKELFDSLVLDFINRKGDIHKVDFSREYNNLPSINYVKIYYGNLNNLKKSFGIEDLSLNWNKESIKEALQRYVSENGEIFQKDLTKAKRLPSLPCILNYYPELNNFSDVKRTLCKLDVPARWTVENAIEAGRLFAERHRKITQKDLGIRNHLPTTKVIYNLFGSMQAYQKAVGVEVSKTNDLITLEEIEEAVNDYFEGKERVVESSKDFFVDFPYSISTVHKNFGSFLEFCKEHGITVLNTKKAKYTKREVDDAISAWVRDGRKIPLAKDLSKVGLPSLSVILKYYEDWKEPFYFYEKLYEEVNRT